MLYYVLSKSIGVEPHKQPTGSRVLGRLAGKVTTMRKDCCFVAHAPTSPKVCLHQLLMLEAAGHTAQLQCLL